MPKCTVPHHLKIQICSLSLLVVLWIFGIASVFAQEQENLEQDAQAAHEALFAESRYPSATTCKTCHPNHYREWSVSAHAYAQMSPVFNAMHAAIVKLTNGSNGDFCIRCHTPVGMNMEEPVFMSNLDRHPTSREGITCISCHRVNKPYGKISGRQALVEGDIFEAVYGTRGNENLQKTIDEGKIILQPERGKPGRAVHSKVEKIPFLATSGFCGTCHDVNLFNGFRLEEAFSDFKTSPASAQGITCQDCHMGKVPGEFVGRGDDPERDANYAWEPAATIGGKSTPPRKRTNHMFAGPDYSIVHPGIFPHNVEAQEFATLREWLQFDYNAGWGTDAFEDTVSEDKVYPERWTTWDDRVDGLEIIEQNLQLLKDIEEERYAVLRAGYKLGNIEVEKVDQGGIKFKIEVRNGMNGHSTPTGFDAERLVYLRVTVTDKNGKEVFISGDVDPNGDVRDLHSLYVHDGKLPLDKYLFSLQSRFLVRMARGGEREQVLAVNYSPDPLPFIRPSTRATALLGRPVGARKHRQVIPPLSSKWPKYKVSKSQLKGSEPPYQVNVKMIAQMVPVNLIFEIKDVGFDYGMSPREVADAIIEGQQVLYDRTITLEKGSFSPGE